jgi:hypothetical protein
MNITETTIVEALVVVGVALIIYLIIDFLLLDKYFQEKIIDYRGDSYGRFMTILISLVIAFLIGFILAIVLCFYFQSTLSATTLDDLIYATLVLMVLAFIGAIVLCITNYNIYLKKTFIFIAIAAICVGAILGYSVFLGILNNK